MLLPQPGEGLFQVGFRGYGATDQGEGKSWPRRENLGVPDSEQEPTEDGGSEANQKKVKRALTAIAELQAR